MLGPLLTIHIDCTWDSIEEIFAAGNENLKEILQFGTKNSYVARTLPTLHVGELPSLRELYLQSCGFADVPVLHSVTKIPYLEKLDLSNNHIQDLNPEVEQLESISRFAISHNQLTTLPKELGNLRRLEYFDFRCVILIVTQLIRTNSFRSATITSQ